MIENELLIEKAKKYAAGKAGKSQLLSDPIIRLENGKYYIGFMYLDFVDEKNNNYNFSRPREWFLVDASTGEVVSHFTSDTKDFNNQLPLDKTFGNEGNSALYDYTNFLLSSYDEWIKDITKKVMEKNEIDKSLPVYNEKVVDIDDTITSPREHILSFLDYILEETRDTLITEAGDSIQNGYNKYYGDLLRKLRSACASGVVEKEDNERYLRLLEYSWPGLSEVYRSFSNL